jgi:hypothetical protein
MTGVLANEELRIEELNTTGQQYRTKNTKQIRNGRTSVTRAKDCSWTHDCFRCKVCLACLM